MNYDAMDCLMVQKESTVAVQFFVFWAVVCGFLSRKEYLTKFFEQVVMIT